LGDLKIPARISQAQVGLKRDLGMVREFAAEVESEFTNCPLKIAGG
jgi:serine/arginine repetitive matrix protein 2